MGSIVTLSEAGCMLMVKHRFMVNPRLENRDAIISTIHRALVEIMTLKEAGMPLEINRRVIRPTSNCMQAVAETAKFTTSENGQASLDIDQDLRQAVQEYTQATTPVVTEEVLQEGNQSGEHLMTQENLQEEFEEADVEWRDTANFEEPKAEKVEPREAEYEEVESDQAESQDPESNDVEYQETQLSQIASNEDPIVEAPEEPSFFIPTDNSWRQVSLADRSFKFAVGVIFRIDSVLANNMTVA